MAKKKYSFFAPIANATGRVDEIHLGNDIVIKRMAGAKAVKLWKEITFSSDDVEADFASNNCFVGSKNEMFVVKCEREFEEPDWSIIENNLAFHHKLDAFGEEIREKLALVRLFLDGNIDLFGWNWYELTDTETESIGGSSGYAMDSVPATVINKRNIIELNKFTSKYSREQMPEFIKLAYDNLNASYEIYRNSVQFLLLAVSLEAVFNTSKQELRYRISRNVAVLLGVDNDHSKSIFSSIKELYDKRSKLVHTGSSKDIHYYDTHLLRTYVRRSIIAILELGWNKEDISSRLNELGFGQGPYSRPTKNKILLGW